MPAQALGAALATEPDPNIWHKDIVDGVHYPSSDGEPMSDNQWQGKAIIHAASDLEVAFPDAMVASDLLVYPEEGNPKNRIAPDVLVAFDIGSHKRPSYRVWQEGKPPDWVLEVVSPRTGRRDLEEKPSPTPGWACRSTGCSIRLVVISYRPASRTCRAGSWWTAPTSRSRRGWRTG